MVALRHRRGWIYKAIADENASTGKRGLHREAPYTGIKNTEDVQVLRAESVGINDPAEFYSRPFQQIFPFL